MVTSADYCDDSNSVLKMQHRQQVGNELWRIDDPLQTFLLLRSVISRSSCLAILCCMAFCDREIRHTRTRRAKQDLQAKWRHILRLFYYIVAVAQLPSDYSPTF